MPGRDVARQLLVSEIADASLQVLQLLEQSLARRKLSASKVEKGKRRSSGW